MGPLAHKIVNRAALIGDLFAPEAQITLKSLSMLLSYLMSVADIERRHKTNKGLLATKSESFASFVAVCNIAEWRAMARRSVTRIDMVREALQGLPMLPSLEDKAPKPEKRLKRKSAFENYVEEIKNEHKLEKRNVQELCFTKAGRRILREGWRDLPQSERFEFGLRKPKAAAVIANRASSSEAIALPANLPNQIEFPIRASSVAASAQLRIENVAGF